MNDILPKNPKNMAKKKSLIVVAACQRHLANAISTNSAVTNR